MIFAACTIGGEEPQGVVSLESSDVTVVEEEELSFEEGVLEFSQCMREEGIDFPDPSFDVDGNPNFDEVQVDNEEEFEEAFIACEDILRNAFPDEFDVDPEVEAALIDCILRVLTMHERSRYRFSRSKPGEFGFFAFRDADIDFNSEAVQEAFEICQPENPLDNLDE